MQPTRRAGRQSWLSAAKIAKLCGGKVLSRGRAGQRIATDSRGLEHGDVFLALRGERHDAHRFVGSALASGAAGAIVQVPVDPTEVPTEAFVVQVPDTAAALMALAAEHRRLHPARVVGITGSCGKTSTKDMLASVLERALPTVASPRSYNNQIGVPLTLFQMQRETQAAVVEIGTNAPGEIAQLAAIAQPDIGIVTCVAEAHLEGLGSLGGVAEEKGALVEALPSDGLAILNGDDRAVRAMAERTGARAQLVRVESEADWFATEPRFSCSCTTFLLQGERQVTLPRLGTHNIYNALFTIAAATELGVALDDVLEGLCRTPPSSRRLELRQLGQVTVIDDTYNANPASARAGLRALAGLHGRGRRVAVLGDMLELGDRSRDLHVELGGDVARTGVDLLVAIGEHGDALAQGARDAGMAEDAVIVVDSSGDALTTLLGDLQPDDRIFCKASRRVGLDRVVDSLAAELSVRS